jgi:hypothetical protein
MDSKRNASLAQAKVKARSFQRRHDAAGLLGLSAY